jgi:hypothetical protein
MTTGSELAVDVVVNNHNYGAYVVDAVESARAQDHARVNVVVVDDGSTDDSRDRLEAYDGTVEVLLTENRGQAAALNAGFAHCRGEVVIFLDADDVLAPFAASHAAAALAAQPRASRAHFRMRMIDADGRPLGHSRPATDQPLPHGDLRRPELAFPFDMAWPGTSGNAFRTESLRRIMPIPERSYGRWGADWYLVHLTTLLGEVVALDEAGAFYRLHGANAFEPAAPVLNLERIRREIGYQQTTAAALTRLADELNLARPDPILSLSNLALRLISRKLAPAQHPVASDRAPVLLAQACRAAARRYDVPWAVRAAMVACLAVIAASPRRLSTRLAELFVFPERRRRLTRVIAGVRRGGRAP